MTYAQMLDIPFAYSSNGDGFMEHDFLTGQEREIGLDEFPSEQELATRYKQESGLTPRQEAILEQPYYSSQNTYPPRYYQRIAINRTVDAIARGQQRPFQPDFMVIHPEPPFLSPPRDACSARRPRPGIVPPSGHDTFSYSICVFSK